ncbi:MAG: hypothetical protein WC538_05895 [Thermoanaerobaculia bacterium]
MQIRPVVIIFVVAALALQVVAEDRFAAEIAEVEAIRGRKFSAEVKHETLPRTKLREFLRAQIDRDLPMETDDYLAALKAVFLVGPDVTMEPLLDLYDAQVLAFYDPATHVYYSLDEPPKDVPMPPPMVRAIEIHELTHALQDQEFGAGRKSIDLQSDWDAALAYQSVLEGEATLVMLAELGKNMGIDVSAMVAQEGMLQALRDAAARGDSIPAGIPPYFVDSLQFPYVEGLSFVIDIFKDGGWKALDAVHANPPISTEEILRPALYRERVARDARPAATQVEAGHGDLVTVLGEFHWRFLLGEKAGDGWGGDRVEIRSGERGATVLADTTWDSPVDAREFAVALAPLLDRKNARNVRVETSGTRVLAGWGVDAKAIAGFVKKK